MSDLFNSPALMIEQPRKIRAAEARYSVFNAAGDLVAVVTEIEARRRRPTLKAVQVGAQRLLVASPGDEVPLLILHKQEGGRRTDVLRPDETPVGSFQSTRTTRHYALHDERQQKIGEIVGDLSLRNFSITDSQNVKVAQVTKKWAGLAAEVLTTADRYTIDIPGAVPEPLHTLIAMSAIVLDLVLHETK